MRSTPFGSFLALVLLFASPSFLRAQPYQDRFVWVFGYNLSRDGDIAAITKMLEDGAKHGIDGAVLSSGMDSMSRQPAAYFRGLEEVQRTCDRLHIELIPAGFSIGYGSAALGTDKMLAEGLPVTDALFIVHGNEARLVPDESVHVNNGGFEESKNNKFACLAMQDQPGEITFADTSVHHGGGASIRFENFTANQYGHGRIMQKISVKPHRCYRMSLWVKTENLGPAHAFRVTALANNRDLAPREFNVRPTQDWQKITMLINSLDQDSFNLYAGVWGGKSGKFWLDDWTLEEIGPMNVLQRPGTPVTVKSEDGSTTFVQGKDYASLTDPNFNFNYVDRNSVPLKILPGGAIKDGQKLLVSWYHPMTIHDGQITVCMAEPKLYEIMDHEAQLLAQHLHPSACC